MYFRPVATPWDGKRAQPGPHCGSSTTLRRACPDAWKAYKDQFFPHAADSAYLQASAGQILSPLWRRGGLTLQRLGVCTTGTLRHSGCLGATR